MPCVNTLESSHLNFTYAQVDYLLDNGAAILLVIIYTLALLKRRQQIRGGGFQVHFTNLQLKTGITNSGKEVKFF